MNFFSFNSETIANILKPFQSIGLKGLTKTSFFINLEYIFGNISFIVLFIAVLLYWFDFSDTKPVTKKLKSFCMFSSNLSLTFLLIVRWWVSGHFPLSNLYESLIGLAWGFTAVHLVITSDLTKIFRPQNKNNFVPHFATSTRGLSPLGFASANPVSKGHLEMTSFAPVSPFDLAAPSTSLEQDRELEQEHNPQSRNLDNKGFDSKAMQQTNNEKIGAITAPTALLTSVFATFFLPPEMLKATTLIPALKSNWLTMHVSVMVISYAFLLVGSLLSIAFCAYRFVTQATNKNQNNGLNQAKDQGQNQTSQNSKSEGFSDLKTQKVNFNQILEIDEKKANHIQTQLDISIWLNTTSYRILGLGFPLLTIGILSGAVWANEAWGSYWSWDPKETWALITWLVFAIYFHSRYNRSSEDSIVPASIASVGFVVIWVCYLGVNLLGKGLHSYGGFVS